MSFKDTVPGLSLSLSLSLPSSVKRRWIGSISCSDYPNFTAGLDKISSDRDSSEKWERERERERERESSGRIRAQRGLPYRTSTHLFGYFYPSPSVRKTYVLFVHKFEVFSSPFCADVIYRSPQRSVRRRRERVLIGESFVLSKREVNFLSFLPHSFETNKGIVFSGN